MDAGQARLSHKQVEQHRRLKAKQYFGQLRCLVPTGLDQKNDRNKVLSLAVEHLRSLKAGKGATAEGASTESNSDLIFSMDADDMQQVKPLEPTKAGDAEEDKRLSHNEVEQKRRQQARQHYEELRALLPNSAKFDKNTLLQHAIQAIRERAGVSEQELARMMAEMPASADNEGDGMGDCGEADASAASAAAMGLAQLAGAAFKSPLSESPTDVLSFAASIAWGPRATNMSANAQKDLTQVKIKAEQSKEGVVQGVESHGEVQGRGGDERKRKVGEDGVEPGVARRVKLSANFKTGGKEPEARPEPTDEVASAGTRMVRGGTRVRKSSEGESAATEDADRKKSRVVWPEAAEAAAKPEGGAAMQLAKEGGGQVTQRAFEDEMDGLDALSLLSHCAVQLQSSMPNTPVLSGREMSWGETSIMNALPAMSLQASAPSSASKGSMIVRAAVGALAAARK